ncbi:hypothetical protein [Haloarcula salinisoli]|uniref:Archaeal histidine kinase 4TM domain-containing protein n=1 Tax=Haloarcula salinisoli TaxID=2487746 RepID=A0A8J7YEX8_9EURY|nr:hypothetical protein [Halomicroarcula salinisoli]MBX0286920.1 hypothetical protein [Halomicroarcula salinisoli]MBX0304222.1 hypothetical protein [Halomicroarcula salinisoli]
MHRRTLAGAGLAAVGLVLAGIQLVHAIQQTDIPVAIAVDGVPFAAMGLALVYAGYRLARDDAFEGTATRVVVWGAGATVAFAAVAALLLFSQQVTMGSLDRAAFLTVDILTVGALTGVLVGLYDAQSRQRLQELETERDRVEAFGRKAADVNNYGRAIATAGSDDAIAAYITEAISSLMGIDETAVLRVRDEEAELLSNTVRTAGAEQVAELARAVRDEPRGDVVAHGRAPPVELGETVSDVLTAVVTERDETTTVVVAVETSGTATDEHDRKLLELVVAHATVRLDRLAAQPA